MRVPHVHVSSRPGVLTALLIFAVAFGPAIAMPMPTQAQEECGPLSDEFAGDELDTTRWSFRHPTTPDSGPRAPHVEDGSLVLPLGPFSLDQSRSGPTNILGQPLPAGDWTVTAQISAPGLDTDDSGEGSEFAQAGLKVYQGDNNWIKIAHTRIPDSTPAETYFEMTYESTSSNRTLGPRVGQAAGAVNLPTWWMRVQRTGDMVTAAFSHTDPDGPGGARWTDMGIAANIDLVMPPGNGPRYIGAYGGNGSIDATYDYIRFEPDGVECKVLIYTGTTGYRHSDAITNGVGPVQDALDEAGIAYDWEDCDDVGGEPGNCDHPDKNPRIFTPENLAQYDAILLFNASSRQQGAKENNVLWDDAQREAIVEFMMAGGGIAANHNSVDMGHAATTWDWWDGPGGRSAVGTIMPGHAQTSTNNRAPVQIEDSAHPSTEGLANEVGAVTAPALAGEPIWLLGDEHYNFATNVRGAAHILATLDESAPTYNPGGNSMGDDHPISWCKPYDGGRVWLSGIGHFGSIFTANGGDNNAVRHLVGGVAWAAGAQGSPADCDYDDTLAPETTHTLDPSEPDGADGAHATPPEVTLSAIDDSGHTATSGVVTEYRIDGGEWIDYTEPFQIAGPGAGEVTVSYRSTDRTGNVEEAKQFSVTVS